MAKLVVRHQSSGVSSFVAQMTWLFQKLFPGLTWRTALTDSVHLTFDDGPHTHITPWVLDQLDVFGAKATFFCVGKNAERYPGLIDDIRLRGHSIGNHTYAHLNGWKTSLSIYIADVNRCDEVIQSNLFRPPYGKMSWLQMQVLKKRFEIIMWDVMPADFDEQISGDRLLLRIKSRTKPGSIIVLHESEKAWRNLQTVLPRTLEWIERMGLMSQACLSEDRFSNDETVRRLILA